LDLETLLLVSIKEKVVEQAVDGIEECLKKDLPKNILELKDTIIEN
jgi:hypothetical protein